MCIFPMPTTSTRTAKRFEGFPSPRLIMTIDRHCGGNASFEEIPQVETSRVRDVDRKPREWDGFDMDFNYQTVGI